MDALLELAWHVAQAPWWLGWSLIAVGLLGLGVAIWAQVR